EVLAGDHLQRLPLAGELTVEDGGDLRVELGEGLVGDRAGLGGLAHRSSAVVSLVRALARVAGDPRPRRATCGLRTSSLPGGDPPVAPVATVTQPSASTRRCGPPLSPRARPRRGYAAGRRRRGPRCAGRTGAPTRAWRTATGSAWSTGR